MDDDMIAQLEVGRNSSSNQMNTGTYKPSNVTIYHKAMFDVEASSSHQCFSRKGTSSRKGMRRVIFSNKEIKMSAWHVYRAIGLNIGVSSQHLNKTDEKISRRKGMRRIIFSNDELTMPSWHVYRREMIKAISKSDNTSKPKPDSLDSNTTAKSNIFSGPPLIETSSYESFYTPIKF